MMELLILLVLAIGVIMFFSYAAQAAFKADSRQRDEVERKFKEIVAHFKGESDA